MVGPAGHVLELIGSSIPKEVVVEEDAPVRSTRVLAARAAFDDKSEGWSWSASRRGTTTIVLPPGAARIRLR
jgi:hypothetical protein